MPQLIDLGTIEQQLTTAIGQQETNNGTAGVGATLNNPDAIKFAPWEVAYGGIPTTSGFAQFPSLANGYAAAKALIDNYIQSGVSLQTLIETYSPSSDGNTNNPARVASLAKTTGLNPNQSILGQIGTAVKNSLKDPTGTGAIKSAGSTALSAAGFSWSRIAAFIMGVAFTVIGLMLLKQTQIVVQNVQEKAAQVSKLAVVAAA